MGVRGCPRMPSESNFDHAAVSQEGGCQLNHLHGDVIHPCNVPTQHKINPEASILPRPRALAMSLASWYTAAAVYSRAYSFFVLYTDPQRTHLCPRYKFHFFWPKSRFVFSSFFTQILTKFQRNSLKTHQEFVLRMDSNAILKPEIFDTFFEILAEMGC